MTLYDLDFDRAEAAQSARDDAMDRSDDELFARALVACRASRAVVTGRSRCAFAVGQRRMVALELREKGLSWPRVGRLIGRGHMAAMSLCGEVMRRRSA